MNKHNYLYNINPAVIQMGFETQSKHLQFLVLTQCYTRSLVSFLFDYLLKQEKPSKF